MPPSEHASIPSWIYDYTTVKSFTDAVRKIAWDVKAHADNVPVTGVKGEVTGGSVTATGGSLSVFGVQTEYNLVKHEATAIDLNKILERGAERRREEELEGRFRRLETAVVSVKNLVERVERELTKTATDIRRRQDKDYQQLKTWTDQLRDKLKREREELLKADQMLHQRISKLRDEGTKVGRKAAEHSRSLEAKAEKLETRVNDGLRKVEALGSAAHKANGDIGDLIQRVTALERALH
ncbi:hypothetical protein ACFZDK_33560 [Streptomyces sp. NPDC007901]|uniref:hypothetical protein n=1 Tax=Streptomyces sp. NPDC007901 TaxID=3364785 RepID=UPI0036E4F2A2